ncbi:helix-turn-helix domain-containing protein [Hyphococcus sp.]|uniref:helix-turn-helix domain-containing protein n=1 Tax=Hyphococcus sp. TaxID=2038636 RepID=UPI0035C71CD5
MTVAEPQFIKPSSLAIWIKSLRTAQDLSQEAVAVAAGIDVRSVQRAEKGLAVSRQTRLSLARGLGYDNIDVFDNPASAEVINGFVSDLAALAEKEELRKLEEAYPDCIRLNAHRAKSARTLCDLACGCQGLSIHFGHDFPKELEDLAATISDWLRDFGDIADELSIADKLSLERELNSLVDELTEQSGAIFAAQRDVRFRSSQRPETKPFEWTIGYLAFGGGGKDEALIIAPRQVRMT